MLAYTLDSFRCFHSISKHHCSCHMPSGEKGKTVWKINDSSASFDSSSTNLHFQERGGPVVTLLWCDWTTILSSLFWAVLVAQQPLCKFFTFFPCCFYTMERSQIIFIYFLLWTYHQSVDDDDDDDASLLQSNYTLRCRHTKLTPKNYRPVQGEALRYLSLGRKFVLEHTTKSTANIQLTCLHERK